MRQYLHASLKVHGIISLPVVSEEGGVMDMFFQVLSNQSKPLFVRTVSLPEDEDFEQGLYSCSVQPFSRWGTVDVDTLPTTAECFVYADPCLVDLLLITDASTSAGECRRRWLSWDTRPSDVDGCLGMHSPKALAPELSLSDRAVPVLCLLDALAAGGYDGGPEQSVAQGG